MSGGTWHGDRFRDAIQREVAARLQRAGAAGVAVAREHVPVRTGRTRAAVTATVDRATLTLEIRAEARWAVFIELGTRRRPARPFLRPALVAAIKALGS
jgi:hypothetical protein